MARPLMQHGVAELKTLFEKSKNDVRTLKKLEYELQHRQVPRAVALLAEVRAAIPEATPSGPLSTQASATAPRQSGLWEAPRPSASPESPVVETVSYASATFHRAPAAEKRAAAVPDAAPMSLEVAYKLLGATPGATWESIEMTRRQLVQQAHPEQTKMLTGERSAEALETARRINAAYVTISDARCKGH